MSTTLDRHSDLAAVILGKLLDGGLRRHSLHSTEIARVAPELAKDEPDFVKVFSAILRWLQEEDYIRYTGVDRQDDGSVIAPECVITGHGLAALDVGFQ
jgi:hypothetical protein